MSLLWFMSKAINNERLAVHQKLTALYQDKLADATAKTESLFKARLANLDQIKSSRNPYSAFRKLILEDGFQGAIFWNAEGSTIYPRATEPLGTDASPGSALADAWQLEFAKGQFSEAAEVYGRFTSDDDPHVAVAAIVGKSRCLARLGKIDEAIEECQHAALRPASTDQEMSARTAIENARLLLLSLLKESREPQKHSTLLHQTVDTLMADLYNPAGDRALFPANQNLFIAQKVLATLKDPFRFDDLKAKTQLESLAAAESISIAVAETPRSTANQPDALFQIILDQQPVYAIRHNAQSHTLLVLMSQRGVASLLSGYREAFGGSEAAYRILDAAGNVAAGTPQSTGSAFTVAPLPASFPGWKAELYFQGGDIFQKAANRQIAVYVWTGILVIALILIAAVFAMRAIGRQIRLNEMKNDFIATVSHELKTPLASMRVLVDTLLEGRVRDEAQAQEYLRLTAKENERLSRMIDNFLTFSRMERNKMAFAITDAAPAAIVHDAVESVQTKFSARNCHLSVELADGLPEIQADHDAVVTVLVNLLDNACKYTNDDKRVALKVFTENDSVCFAVSDNGIGLARKHLRKIFDRFYQVDSSLARKAEGCGLGLSIVKFIADAHKGTVSVESKPGQGSTFTVRLPVSQKNED